MSSRAAALRQLFAERIVVLDGAMGTMIQQYKLSEADWRGERLRDHHKDLRGNSDALILTRPDYLLDDASEVEFVSRCLSCHGRVLRTLSFRTSASATRCPPSGGFTLRRLAFAAARVPIEHETRAFDVLELEGQKFLRDVQFEDPACRALRS